MSRKLRYLGPSERAEIERLHNGGAPAAVISEKVGSHVATIYRELPNGYTGTVDEYGRRVYSAEIAQRMLDTALQWIMGFSTWAKPPGTCPKTNMISVTRSLLARPRAVAEAARV